MSTAFEKQKLCHSLGRPSRSDFVQFEFEEAYFSVEMLEV